MRTDPVEGARERDALVPDEQTNAAGRFLKAGLVGRWHAPTMIHATTFCLVTAGAFFSVGLAAGTWKYVCIHRSPEGRAPFYVDTAHRAALMYLALVLFVITFIVLSLAKILLMRLQRAEGART